MSTSCVTLIRRHMKSATYVSVKAFPRIDTRTTRAFKRVPTCHIGSAVHFTYCGQCHPNTRELREFISTRRALKTRGVRKRNKLKSTKLLCYIEKEEYSVVYNCWTLFCSCLFLSLSTWNNSQFQPVTSLLLHKIWEKKRRNVNTPSSSNHVVRLVFGPLWSIKLFFRFLISNSTPG